MDNRDPRRNDWVEDAKAEVSGMAKGGMDHPSTKPVLAGAAIGVLAGRPVAGGDASGRRHRRSRLRVLQQDQEVTL